MSSLNIRAVAQLSSSVKDLKAACKRRNLITEYQAYVNIRAKRQSLKTPIKSVREQLRESLISRANKMAANIPRPGYSMGDVIKVHVGKFFTGAHYNTSEYSRSCGYTAKHGYASIYISAADFKSMQTIGGLVTILEERINLRVYKCSWFENKGGEKQHFNLVRVAGYLIRGHHIAAGSLEEAEQIVAEKRRTVAIQILSHRADNKLARLAKSLDLSRIFVTVDDSLRAGNCLVGTNNYADRKQIDLSKIGAVRADWLIENQNGSGFYINRAIEAARLRYAAMMLNK